MTDHQNTSAAAGGENANGNDTSRPEKSDLELEKEYLQESVRLAEVRLEKAAEDMLILDKKAILIMTFCVVIIGFILSTRNVNIGSLVLFLELIICISLTVGLVFGIRVLDLANAGIAGLPPGVTQHFSEHAKKQSAMIEMHQHLLSEYKKRIEATEKTNEHKIEKLKIARDLLIIGGFFAIIWGVIKFFPLFAATT